MRATAAILLCTGVTLLAASATAAPRAPIDSAAPDAALMRLADDFFDHFYFPVNPTIATQVGIHRYDEQLEDYSRAGVERQIAALHAYERRFADIDGAALSERVRGDRDLLLSYIRSALLSLQSIRPWQKNADFYSSGITTSAFVIMEREFAPPNERLRLLIARERLMPAALQAARENLRAAPEVFTRIAIEQLPGDVSFFAHELPQAFESADDAALKASFRSVNNQVVEALKSYQTWLRRRLLPRSHGDFRLGASAFRAKLAYDEMVDPPLARLLAIGSAALRRNQAEFARGCARALAPRSTA